MKNSFNQAVESLLNGIDLNLDVSYDSIQSGDCAIRVVDARTVFINILIDLGYSQPMIHKETGISQPVISASKKRHKKRYGTSLYRDKYDMVKELSGLYV